MNERIKELEKQCWSHRVNGRLVDGQLHFDTQKFAELILLEVTDILSTYRGKIVFEDGAEYNYEHPIIAIRKHFGVEQ